MKALILAAGLGTRLLPLTENLPKALVKVHESTLLELTIRKLSMYGFTEIIINAHHHAGQVIEYIRKLQIPGTSLAISDESDQLLDTGGAILKARWFLDGNEPFLVHNVDVISDLDLTTFLQYHRKNNNIATLSVIERKTKRYFLFDDQLYLCGWTDTATGEIRGCGKQVRNARKFAFSGIHVISPEIFSLITEEGRFSIVDLYLRLAGSKTISGYIQPGMTWFDAGKPEQIEIISGFLKDHPGFTAAL